MAVPIDVTIGHRLGATQDHTKHCYRREQERAHESSSPQTKLPACDDLPQAKLKADCTAVQGHELMGLARARPESASPGAVGSTSDR